MRLTTLALLLSALAGPALAAEPPQVAPAAQGHPGLLDPSQAAMEAPATFDVEVETTQGSFKVRVQRDWAPKGADRFYSLVKIGYLDGVGFFRAIEGFMTQFGLHGEPAVNQAWMSARIPDDPVAQSNARGRITFATSGPNSRTTQLFINTGSNGRLDGMGFAPFGEVIEGMEVVDKLYKGYGEGAPRGRGPNQGTLRTLGNDYLSSSFPLLDYIVKARVLEAS